MTKITLEIGDLRSKNGTSDILARDADGKVLVSAFQTLDFGVLGAGEWAIVDGPPENVSDGCKTVATTQEAVYMVVRNAYDAARR